MNNVLKKESSTQNYHKLMKNGREIMKKLISIILIAALILSMGIIVSAEATVKNGTTNADVAKLQKELNTVLGCNLAVDSIAGPKTIEQIKIFQKMYGLVVDGIAGAQTWAALNKAYADKIASTANNGYLITTTYNSPHIVTLSKSKDGNKYLTKNFQVKEFACNDGSDAVKIDYALVQRLQQIRDHFGKAVVINSAYRTAAYNQKVNGASKSLHLTGQAADITISGVSLASIRSYAYSIGLTYGIYDTFVHVDTRNIASPSSFNGDY